MSKLEEIIAHGNRGHRHIDNNRIVCADGWRVSVIAGGGTYCTPRPALCTCSFAPELVPAKPFGDEVAHDYPGPYSEVEIWADDEEDVRRAPVDEVRALVASHGGEVS